MTTAPREPESDPDVMPDPEEPNPPAPVDPHETENPD